MNRNIKSRYAPVREKKKRGENGLPLVYPTSQQKIDSGYDVSSQEEVGLDKTTTNSVMKTLAKVTKNKTAKSSKLITTKSKRAAVSKKCQGPFK